MLFTCSLRCTDQVTSKQSTPKLSLGNRNSRLKCALYSDISLTPYTHHISTKKNFTVCVKQELIYPHRKKRGGVSHKAMQPGIIWHLEKQEHLELSLTTSPDELQMTALFHVPTFSENNNSTHTHTHHLLGQHSIN